MKYYCQSGFFSLQWLNRFQSENTIEYIDDTGTLQTVIDLFAPFFRGNDPGTFQDRQMLTDGGEPDTDGIDKLTDTMFCAVRKLSDDPHPGGMGERLEKFRFCFTAIFFIYQHSKPHHPYDISFSTGFVNLFL